MGYRYRRIRDEREEFFFFPLTSSVVTSPKKTAGVVAVARDCAGFQELLP